LKAIKNGFLKNLKRFTMFEKTTISEASPPSGASFNVGGALDGIVRRLLRLTSPTVMEVEAQGQGVAEEGEEGHGDGEEDLDVMEEEDEEQEGTEERWQEPLQMNASRPQRRAAQFGFVRVKGVPV
jgi:TATA-binding protein-associated factor Taf7